MPYRELLCAGNYHGRTTTVIGHLNPDSDSICSAMAFARLLNQLAIPAVPAATAPPNNECRVALSALGLTPPTPLDDALGGQFFLVDHSSYYQALPNMDQATVVGILDHHALGDVRTSEPIFVRTARAGSTASLVYLSFRECGIPLERDVARTLLIGLLSDTRNMGRDVGTLERLALQELKEVAEVPNTNALYQLMLAGLTSYGGMDDRAIFLSDFKRYEDSTPTFGIADVNAPGEHAMRELTERMYRTMLARYDEFGLDLLFVKTNNKTSSRDEHLMCMAAHGKGAKELLCTVFQPQEEGHLLLFERSLSRKSVVAPSIRQALEGRGIPTS